MTTPPIPASSPLRIAALAVALAGTLFWFYTFYAIAQLPQGDGTGFQWVAEMPLTLIFVVLTFPALALAWGNRRLVLSLILGLAGLAAFTALWMELLTEFAH